MPEQDLGRLCINTLRMLSVDMVEKAKSGHPGMPMGAAPAAYALWTGFLRFNPQDPLWPDRDRFVLSAGHGSALLYSLLHLTGYPMTLDELKSFRQWGSPTPGHPERDPARGVECTTGPLGQGIANAVGMAVAERFLAARFNRPGHEVVGHNTYVLAGDGDMMEGVACEAASLAGHLRLGRLICIYDDNRISLSGDTGLCFTEDVCGRFEAQGWHVQRVADGNDLAAIRASIAAAIEEKERPSLIAVRTHIGFGSPRSQDTHEAHGSPLGPDETRAVKLGLGWPIDEPFHVPDEARAVFRAAGARGEKEQAGWAELMDSYAGLYPKEAAEFRDWFGGRLPDGWEKALPVFPHDAKGMATRVAGGSVLNALAGVIPNLIGGSADLDPSTMTVLRGGGAFQSPDEGDGGLDGAPGGAWGYDGRNISFGVREHAMAAVANGMACHGGVLPFGATFLIFSDYMKPSVRLSALSGLRVVYVFTHDSVAVGEDGPTHQPVEQLAGLRAVPGLIVIRPADANETVQAWRAALGSLIGPVALVLSRQALPTLDRSRCAPADGLLRGAYVLDETEGSNGKPDLIIIASGSEVHPALAASTIIERNGLKVRVVSMPSWELFEMQPESYREEVLPPEVSARISVEAGSTQGWCRYAGAGGETVGIDRFGASAPGGVNMQRFGFTAEEIAYRAAKLLYGR